MKKITLLTAVLALHGTVAFCQPHHMAEPPKESRPFLGVEVTNAPKSLTSQLKLPQGMGLVVEYVAADSPAQSAGLQPYDILTKYDDQLLADPDQLAALVRIQDVQKPVKLTVIREGEQKEVTAKLETRELPVRQPKRLRASIGTFELPVPPFGPAEAMPPGVPAPRIKIFRSQDKEGTFILKDGEGKKEAEFVDSKGTIIFKGDVPAGIKDELPEQVRRKLEELEKQERPLVDVFKSMDSPLAHEPEI